MRIEQGFQQTAPVLQNIWDNDPTLKSIISRLCDSHAPQIGLELCDLATNLRTKYSEYGFLCDHDLPRVTQYDHYGQRIDKLHTSEGWRLLKRAAATEGIVSTFYDRDLYGPAARVFGFAKTYLWAPDTRMVSCPLSMTDGAARVIELYGTEQMKKEVLPRLISRDPDVAWTAGQWMTERPGGSDVSMTETTARPVQPAQTKNGDAFLLDGFKWFSSATDGDVALALARTNQDHSKGSRGLSLFLVKLRLSDQEAEERIRLLQKLNANFKNERSPSIAEAKQNGIRIHRLKDKIGTKALPTAELSLSGTIGHLIGELNQGVRTIAHILNITRLHSLFSTISSLRRCLSLALSFSQVRKIGPTLLSSNALHNSFLVKAAVLQNSLLHFGLGLASLMGKSECGVSTAREEDLLRLLTPVGKAFAAGQSSSAFADCMEAMGGQGYMEESGVGRLMRDAAVERVWEGTQTVLALDVLRVVRKSNGGALKSFAEWLGALLEQVDIRGDLKDTLKTVRRTLQHVSIFKLDLQNHLLPRALLNILGCLACCGFIIEQLIWSKSEVDYDLLQRWVESSHFVLATTEFKQATEVDKTALEKDKKVTRELLYGKNKL